MRNEDYGRIARVLADGTPVAIQAEIVNQRYPEGKTSYNTIAEIAGSDKKDEVVMLGGHLDSWHSATGATDNAIGCAIMMEAARILKTIGVQPRRTIRVALWSGEEEGLLGSLAYVKEHFGSAEAPKPEFATFAGYLNIDSGTGRARGASVFGPPDAGRILREALAPVKDLGVAGATVTTSRNVGGTDSTSFNNAGLPGIGFGQDSIEYGSHTHHTNLDTYERVIEDDVKASAVAAATLLYQLAMRDQLLPRFSATDMPAASAGTDGGAVGNRDPGCDQGSGIAARCRGSCRRTAPPGARPHSTCHGCGLRARRGAPFGATRERASLSDPADPDDPGSRHDQRRSPIRLRGSGRETPLPVPRPCARRRRRPGAALRAWSA